MQTKWPRGRVILAKPLVEELVRDPKLGNVYKKKRPSKFVPVKIIDVRVRSFKKKMDTRGKMLESGIARETPLADYTLRVLVKENGGYKVQTLSFAYVDQKEK